MTDHRPAVGKTNSWGWSWAKWALFAPTEGGVTFVALWPGPKTVPVVSGEDGCKLCASVLPGTCLAMCVLGKRLSLTSHLFPLARKCVQYQLLLTGPPLCFHLLPFFCNHVCVLLSPLPAFTSGPPFSPSVRLQIFHPAPCCNPPFPLPASNLVLPSITIPLLFFPAERPLKLSTC